MLAPKCHEKTKHGIFFVGSLFTAAKWIRLRQEVCLCKIKENITKKKTSHNQGNLELLQESDNEQDMFISFSRGSWKWNSEQEETGGDAKNETISFVRLNGQTRKQQNRQQEMMEEENKPSYIIWHSFLAYRASLKSHLQHGAKLSECFYSFMGMLVQKP